MKKYNEEFIEELLEKDECDTLDFKCDQYKFENASIEDKSELLKDILAFANADRKTDAYILIGVREVKGGRSIPIGISQDIDDANLQQFVNKKVQKPVIFSYNTVMYKKMKLGLIHIPIQDRLIYLMKDYGKLGKNIVYIRRGTSTDIAFPNEIIEMNRSDDKRTISGITASVLSYLIEDANTKIDSSPKPDEIATAININLEQCREAFDELESLAIIETMGDVNSPIGYSCAHIKSSSFVLHVSQCLPNIDIVEEIKNTLSAFPIDGEPIASDKILQSLKIPLARLQRIIAYLESYSLIEATKGWIGENKLRFMWGKLLPLGKRVLKGDDQLPLLK